MRQITPPLIVVKEGDFPVSIYRTEGSAVVHLEPWYVEEFAPRAFDAQGKCILIRDGDHGVQLIVEERDDPAEAIRALAETLVDHVRELESARSLEELIKVFVRVFGSS